jgi:hypothetical protein
MKDEGGDEMELRRALLDCKKRRESKSIGLPAEDGEM